MYVPLVRELSRSPIFLEDLHSMSSSLSHVSLMESTSKDVVVFRSSDYRRAPLLVSAGVWIAGLIMVAVLVFALVSSIFKPSAPQHAIDDWQLSYQPPKHNSFVV